MVAGPAEYQRAQPAGLRKKRKKKKKINQCQIHVKTIQYVKSAATSTGSSSSATDGVWEVARSSPSDGRNAASGSSCPKRSGATPGNWWVLQRKGARGVELQPIRFGAITNWCGAQGIMPLTGREFCRQPKIASVVQ